MRDAACGEGCPEGCRAGCRCGMRVQDAGLSGAAPDCPPAQDWGGGDAHAEGWHEKEEPPGRWFATLQPLRAWLSLRGRSAERDCGQGQEATRSPHHPRTCTRGGSTQPSAVGSSLYPTGLFPCLPITSPSSILLSVPESNHSWSTPAAWSPPWYSGPWAPAPLPVMLPGLWLQHTGQVAAVIQAWQHMVALPPAWHECDRAATARGRQCGESEQQSRAGTFTQDSADSSTSWALQSVAATG